MESTDSLAMLLTLLPAIVGGGLACLTAVASIAITIAAIVFARKLIANATDRGASIADGITAPALVVGASDTGTTLNDNPRIALQLQVIPPQGEPFAATLTTFVSRIQINLVQSGSVVLVRYSASNPAQIALSNAIGPVEAYAPPSQAMPPLAALLRTLAASQTRATALASAPEHPATILQVEELGLYCNGKNPLLRLHVEVQPAGSAPWTTTTDAVISPLSLEKYRASAAVWVRVDPAQPAVAVLSRAGR